jgi:hypothetical protein
MSGLRQDASDARASSAPFDHEERLTRIAVWRDSSEQQRTEARLEGEQKPSPEARRLALEINDSIVQGLVLAQITLALGGWEQGLAIVSRTLATARRLASDLLGERPVQPGDLVRSPASGPAALDGPPL